MATVIIGCDRNGVDDSGCQNTIAKALEKAGHTVEKLSIGPNEYASYSYNSKAKGKIGVYLIAAGLTSIADAFDGNTYFKYNYFGIRADVSRNLKTMNDFKTRTISKDWHGDCISKSCNTLAGKTFPQINEYTKSKCKAVFGTNHEELGKNLVTEIGGGSSDSDSDGGGSSSGGSIKEALQKLLTYWDGEVECYIRGDEVHVNKIRDPSKYYSSVLYEGVNVFSDSVTLTDVNPNTCNYLEVVWTGGTVTIQDERLIKRFGMVKTIVMANEATVEEEETEDDDKKSDDDKKEEKKKKETKTKEKKEEYNTTTVTAELIDNKDDAMDYAQLYWNKLQRDNGRSLECQTWGSCNFKNGEWCKVYLPTFDLDGFMYITSVSQSNDGGDWTNSLKLVDYPPGWGKYEPPEKNEEEEENADEETEDVENGEENADAGASE